MSLGLVVILAARQVPSSEIWRRALEARSVPIEFPQSLDFAHGMGFVPVRVQGKDSGVYFGRESLAELVQYYPPLSDVRLDSPVAFSLRFHDGLECACAAYSAALLVGKFQALAFSLQVASFLSEAQLIEAAKACARAGRDEP